MKGSRVMPEEKPAAAELPPAADAPSEKEKPVGRAEAPAPAPVPEETTPPDWESRFKYVLADFENYRKRSERDREAIRRRAEGDILRTFLPIHDSFERAREFLNDVPATDPVRRGIELLAREWETFLKREGIAPVAEVGRPFDSDEQEVVGETAPSPGHAPGTVAAVVQQGYRFGGGLLRPAKVLVVRATGATTEPSHAQAPRREGVSDSGPSE
jgi:molecular chaperone GrpE